MLSGLTNYVPETALTVFDNLEFFIRIVLAAILGALVGLEQVDYVLLPDGTRLFAGS